MQPYLKRLTLPVNAALLEKINASGKIYMSHTTIRGKFTLRFVCAQTNVQQEHVDEAINTITMFAKELI
jgi:aromatic-L-amino-acid/L-tryptophan decarboxylase